MKRGIVKVTEENKTGRNIRFENVNNHEKMNRSQFVRRIESGTSVYSENYFVRKQNGVKTPVAKPDGNKDNNLG